MSNRQDVQLDLLQADLLELERSRRDMPQEKRPGLAYAIAARINEYLDIVHAELVSMLVMATELSMPKSHGEPGPRPSPENINMSPADKAVADAAAGGRLPWWDPRYKTVPSFVSLMIESRGLNAPLPVELLYVINDKIYDERIAAESAGGPVSGLVFNAEIFALAETLEETPPSGDDEVAMNARFFWWQIAALSGQMDRWALQIYDGRLPRAGSMLYYNDLSYFAYECTPMHAHLLSLAGGEKSSKRISDNNLEPIDIAPVGRGIGEPERPEKVAALYGQVMAAAARETTAGVVHKPAWSFDFLFNPRKYRQGAYRTGKTRRQSDVTLYRIAPLERSVFTAVRYIVHGVMAEADIASKPGIRFAEALSAMISPRFKPDRLWTMTLAAVHDILLPHNETRMVFATELLSVLYAPELPPQSTLDRMDDLLPAEASIIRSIYRNGMVDPLEAFGRFQAICLANGISENDIWAMRDNDGKLITHNGIIRLGSVNAVAYNADRQLVNLQQTIANCLKTTLLIKWIKHISKLWAQTARELGIPESQLESENGLSDRDLNRMLNNMGLLRPREAGPVTRDGTKLIAPTMHKTVKNKAYSNPMPYDIESGEKTRRIHIRSTLSLAKGRVKIDAMQVCLILSKHRLGDVSKMHNMDLSRRIDTRDTTNIIKTFMDYGTADVVANLNHVHLQVMREQAEQEIAEYRKLISEDPAITKDQQIIMLTEKINEIDRKYGITELIESIDNNDLESAPVETLSQIEKPYREPESYHGMAREVVNDIISRSYRNGKFDIVLSQKLFNDFDQTPIEVLRANHQAPARPAGFTIAGEVPDFKKIALRIWVELALDPEIKNYESMKRNETLPATSATDKIINALREETHTIVVEPETELRYDPVKAEKHLAELQERRRLEEESEIRVKRSPEPKSDPTLFRPEQKRYPAKGAMERWLATGLRQQRKLDKKHRGIRAQVGEYDFDLNWYIKSIPITGNDRIHTTKDPYGFETAVSNRIIVSQFTDLRRGKIGKPVGIWYSVGREWLELCSEGYGLEGKIHPFHYRLNIDFSDILVIDTEDKFVEFGERYGITYPELYHGGFEWSANDFANIRWPVVAGRYKGIEIAPYMYNFSLGIHHDWYTTWDIASGCIWDLSAIKDYNLLT